MPYLGSFAIDDYVSIPVATHQFSTGAAYAPTALTYSIYEEGNATGLDENVDMVPASPFDGIVGCYLARRQLTAAAGFEAGKNYVVVVKATVDSVAAVTTHSFQIAAKVDAVLVNSAAPDSDADVATAVWASGERTLTAASDSAGIATLLGRILGTLAAGTHTPQSGDAYARLGAAGAGLTALGDARVANLDATVSSRLATAAYTVPPTTAAIAAAVWAYVIGATSTALSYLRDIGAAVAGKSSGAGTGTETFRDVDDTKNVLVATMDANGNRTAIARDRS